MNSTVLKNIYYRKFYKGFPCIPSNPEKLESMNEEVKDETTDWDK